MKKVIFLLIGTLFFAGCGIQSNVEHISPEYVDALKKISTNDYFFVDEDMSEIDLTNHVGQDAYLVSFNLSTHTYNLNSGTTNFGFIEFNSTESQNESIERSVINKKIDDHPTHLFLKEINNLYKNKDFSKKAVNNNLVENVNYKVGDKRKLYYEKNVNIDRTVLNFIAECKYVGDNCVLWFNNNTNISGLEEKLDFAFLGQKFDYLLRLHSELIDVNYMESTNSSYISFPDNYKLNIVLYDINSNCNADDVVGYFYPLDYISKDVNIYSNEGKFIYLDSLYEKGVFSTFIHEYTHLKTFEQKTLINNLEYSTWYTEMFSMLAQEMFEDFVTVDDNDNENLHNRISNALSTSQLGHFYWLDLDNDYVYASYANHYLFGTYLVHNFGGLSFFKEMMNNNFVNIESIDEALKSKNSSTFEAFIKFPQIRINCENTNKNFYSLNKDTDSYFSADKEIKVFNAINLNDFSSYSKRLDGFETKYNKIEKVSENGVDYFEIYGPFLLKNNYFYQTYSPYGYSISYIGNVSEGDTMKIYQPNEKDFVYVLMFTNPLE